MMNIIRGKCLQPWLHLNSLLKTWRAKSEKRLWFNATLEEEILIAFFKRCFVFLPFFSISTLIGSSVLPLPSLPLQCTWWRTGEETTQETRAWRPAGQLCVAAVSGTCSHNAIPQHNNFPLAPHFCASKPTAPSPPSALNLTPPPFPSSSLLHVYK